MILIFFLPVSLGAAGAGGGGVVSTGSAAGAAGGSAASAAGRLRFLGGADSSASSSTTGVEGLILGLASAGLVCLGCTVSEGKTTFSGTGELAK